MLKKLLCSIFAAILLTIMGLGINKSLEQNNPLNNLALNNVEALAQSENPIDVFGCNPEVIAICAVRYDKIYYGQRSN